uniref:Serine-rich protein-like protein n=1 Tax=Davidia involucrata TaxID=16924 RepID=A0A5B6ZFV5_DAVIN
MATSSRKSSGPVLPGASTFQRSISPSRRFSSSSSSSSPSDSYSSYFASSTSSGFCSSPSTGFFHRSSSPTRVNLNGFAPLAPSVRFSIDRSRSPRRSMAVSPRDQVVRKPNKNPLSLPKKTCMCSPTTHPGSFRCSLHKNCSTGHSISYSQNRLIARRSAMTNSLVRIGTVEGDWVRRALAALIRPSSHQQRRRTAFQPRPSRLSVMSKADDL